MGGLKEKAQHLGNEITARAKRQVEDAEAPYSAPSQDHKRDVQYLRGEMKGSVGDVLGYRGAPNSTRRFN